MYIRYYREITYIVLCGRFYGLGDARRGIFIAKSHFFGSFCHMPDCAKATAFSKAAALFSDSWYSLAGTESATRPAPACT